MATYTGIKAILEQFRKRTVSKRAFALLDDTLKITADGNFGSFHIQDVVMQKI